MIGFVRQLLGLFSGRNRTQLFAIILLAVFSAVAEMVGVGAVLPFMQVVADPESIQQSEWLNRIYEGLGFVSPRAFVMAMGLCVLATIAVTSGIRALNIWVMHKYAWAQNHQLSMRVFGSYLSEPYEYFLNRNTAGLNRTLLQEVGSVVNGLLLPFLTAISQGTLVIAILALLTVVNPWLTLLAGTLLGGAYGLIYWYLRAKQRRLGQERLRYNRERFKVAAEAFGGIKLLKVLQREAEFPRRFEGPSRGFTSAMAANQVVSQMPRFLLETLVFGGLVGVLLVTVATVGSMLEVLPVLTLYAFATYRLMPSLHSLFQAIVRIRFNAPSLDELEADLSSEGDREARNVPTGAPEFTTAFELTDVGYRYPGADRDSLSSVRLRVNRGESVGLVGSTGSGKTTLVDILLGLLPQSSGTIMLDGRPLSRKELKRWTRICGYVPQEIYLTDDSIRANIAFAIRDEAVDDAAVERAARAAQIHDFIVSLPQGYDTPVGERGLRLSGGQRQRIGIARGLYGAPEVLIFDEATSALDGATERAVMDTIEAISRTTTLVIIAHRLSTVRRCDVIHILDGGRIVTSGTYSELSAESAEFRMLAGVSDSTMDSEE